MGKVFLLLLVGVAGYAMWAISDRLSSGDDSVVRQVSDGDPVVSQPVAEVVRPAKDEVGGFPELIYAAARCGNWMHVIGEGIVYQGDEMSCGTILRSWNDRLVICVRDGVERVVKIANRVQMEKYVKVLYGSESSQVAAGVTLETKSERRPASALQELFGGGEK